MQSKGLKPGGSLRCSAGESEDSSDASIKFYASIRCKLDFDFKEVLGATDAERFLNLVSLKADYVTSPEIDGSFSAEWSTRFPKIISDIPLGTGRAAYDQLEIALTKAFPNCQFKTDSKLFIGDVFSGKIELDI